MKEIRFLKDLPCKLVNSSKSYIKLVGGDIYYDKDGNRFAFLTFDNITSQPIFYLQLALREYSVEGKLIRDSEFYIPYLYAPRGQFVNEQPIEIDQETEAMEVYIVKATFDRQNFINDKMMPFTRDDYLVNKPSAAPSKKWDSNRESTFDFNKVETRKAAPAQGSTESSVSPISVSPESPVEEKPNLPEDINIEGMPRGNYVVRGKKMKYIHFVAAIGVFIAIALSVYGIINLIVNSFNSFYDGNYYFSEVSKWITLRK